MFSLDWGAFFMVLSLSRHQREEEEKREGLEELTAELTLVKEEVAEERKSRLPQPDEEELHLWPHVQANGLGLKTPGSKSAKKTSEEVVVDLGGDEVSGKQEVNLVLEETNVEEVEANVKREQESGDNSRWGPFSHFCTMTQASTQFFLTPNHHEFLHKLENNCCSQWKLSRTKCS